MAGLYPTPGQSGILKFSRKRALGKDILMEVNQLIHPTPWPNGKSVFLGGAEHSFILSRSAPDCPGCLSQSCYRTAREKSCFISYRCSAIMYCLITSRSLVSSCSLTTICDASKVPGCLDNCFLSSRVERVLTIPGTIRLLLPRNSTISKSYLTGPFQQFLAFR